MTSLARRRSSSEARTTFGLELELLLLAAQMLHMNTNTTTDCWSICFSDIDLAPAAGINQLGPSDASF